MTDELTFDGKVAIVTGAGGGLGRSHALELARRGAFVVVNDLGSKVDGEGSDYSAAQEVVAEIESAGGTATIDLNSVATSTGGIKVVLTALNHWERVDIIINNAGILRDASFHNMTDEQIEGVIATHLLGAFYVTNAAWPHMRQAGYGRVVMTSSGSGMFGNFGQANYGAAKAGLYGLMRTLAVEGATKGIKVNAIAPVARTRMTEEIFERMGVEADLAPSFITPVVTYLASEQCEANGRIFGCGGGMVNEIVVAETSGARFNEEYPLTPESVRDCLPLIGMMEEGYTVPPTLNDQLMGMLGRLTKDAS